MQKLWLQALAPALAHTLTLTSAPNEPTGGISTTLLFILFKDPPSFLFFSYPMRQHEMQGRESPDGIAR